MEHHCFSIVLLKSNETFNLRSCLRELQPDSMEPSRTVINNKTSYVFFLRLVRFSPCKSRMRQQFCGEIKVKCYKSVFSRAWTWTLWGSYRLQERNQNCVSVIVDLLIWSQIRSFSKAEHSSFRSVQIST